MNSKLLAILSIVNMFSKSISLFIAVLLAGAMAKTSSSTISADPTSISIAAPTHTISVGKDGHKFTPDQTFAEVGDIIEYRFYPQNHSVVRGAWKSPCVPYEMTDIGREGFWSGFQPQQLVSDDPPTFRVHVNNTDPIFFYCSAPGACLKDGMIGVINPTPTENFETQLAFAKNSTLMFIPGELSPAEIVSASSPPATSSPTTTITITSEPTASAISASKAASSSSPVLTPGAIAGISIGGAAVLLIAATLLYLCGRQRAMGDLLWKGPSPPLQYLPKPPSMTPSTASGPRKLHDYDYDTMAARRYSSHPYDRAAVNRESYRSRSPPFQYDNWAVPMAPMNLSPTSPERFSPVSPEGRSPSPIIPLGETFYQPLHFETPPPLKFNRDDPPPHDRQRVP